MRARITRLAPGGSAISANAIRALFGDDQAEQVLRRGLGDRFPGRALTLHASGRDALRVVFARLAATTDRREIAVPAYGCFSIPAAAVAVGLRVRLVDLEISGQLDLTSLGRVPLEKTAAIVIANLFGIPDPIRDVVELAREGGARVIDDAAQTFGGRSPEGPVGARADLGILSFGRGKPLSGLGGGAVIWRQAPQGDVVPDAAQEAQPWIALLRAAAYDTARNPLVLRALSAIPQLQIGRTVYDPAFSQGPMSGAAVSLTAALLPELDVINRARTKRAEAIAERLDAETDFAPLLATQGDNGVYPRLGVLAPSSEKRDAALAALVSLGATAMYPTPLDEIPALRPHLVGEARCPGAHEFCTRLLTLPTHAGMNHRRQDELVRVLQTL